MVQLPLGIMGLFGDGPFPSKRTEDLMNVFNPDPSQQPQRGGILSGASGGFGGLLGDPLFNMGIAMMGSRSPGIGGSLADGLRAAQDAQAHTQGLQDNELNRAYKRAQIQRLGNTPVKPFTRKFALPNGQVQDQEYDVQSKQWVPIGSPYARTADNGNSTLQEWEYFNRLPPEDQRRFLEMKRAQKTYLQDVGGAPTVVTPGMVGQSPVQQPLSTPDIENQAAHDRKAAEAAGAATGKVTGEAQASLPHDVAQAEEAIRLVDELIGSKDGSVKPHPGFEASVGAPNPFKGGFGIFSLPGSAAKGFDVRLKQLLGQQFMQAYQTLKGGGQITEVEGEKATQALARMDKAQSEEDFIQGAREFQEVMRKGAERARIKAGQKTPATAYSQEDIEYTAKKHGMTVDEVQQKLGIK